MTSFVSAVGAVSATLGVLLSPALSQTFCSVFDERPCVPSFCSVFDFEPCFPEFDPPIGQDLRLTIDTRDSDHWPQSPAGELDSIRELFAALRGCWGPPDAGNARSGMMISVRFAFKRNGEIIDKPRVTYMSRDAPAETKGIYRDAVMTSLRRCAPMPFSQRLGAALAGRPIALRFVENRNL
jgi:hypothetical protein